MSHLPGNLLASSAAGELAAKDPSTTSAGACGPRCIARCPGNPHILVTLAVFLEEDEPCEDCAGSGQHLDCLGAGCADCNNSGLCVACAGDGDDQDVR